MQRCMNYELYELREADFFEISPSSGDQRKAISAGDDHTPYVTRIEEDGDRGVKVDGDQDNEGRRRWEEALIAFSLLKATIATYSK